MVTRVTPDAEKVAELESSIGISTRRTRGGRGPRGNNGGGGGPGGPSGGPDGGGDRERGRDWSPERYRIGVFVGIASILMMFTALASAYIVRAGLPTSFDWQTTQLPSFLWASTILILASSATYTFSERELRRERERGYNFWLAVTLALGFGFLAAQLLAWRQLVVQGVYLATNPHSSFFYLLTALHGLHLVGGILALLFLLAYSRLGRGGAQFDAKRRTYTGVVGIYWHFMDALWIGLFLLLFFWR